MNEFKGNIAKCCLFSYFYIDSKDEIVYNYTISHSGHGLCSLFRERRKSFMDNPNIVMNPHNNLLTFEEHLYALQDVEEPMFTEIFSHIMRFPKLYSISVLFL